eukprot:m.563715 g.563715  ORF g.563715 m.563715 type:complete len:167 (+) comp22235_c0_seq10:225-725(+)
MMSTAQESVAPVDENSTTSDEVQKKTIREKLDAKLPQNNQQVEGDVDDISVKFAAAGLKLVNRFMRWRDTIATGTLRLIEGKNGRGKKDAAPAVNSGAENTNEENSENDTKEDDTPTGKEATPAGEAGAPPGSAADAESDAASATKEDTADIRDNTDAGDEEPSEP